MVATSSESQGILSLREVRKKSEGKYQSARELSGGKYRSGKSGGRQEIKTVGHRNLTGKVLKRKCFKLCMAFAKNVRNSSFRKSRTLTGNVTVKSRNMRIQTVSTLQNNCLKSPFYFDNSSKSLLSKVTRLT